MMPDRRYVKTQISAILPKIWEFLVVPPFRPRAISIMAVILNGHIRPEKMGIVGLSH